MSGEVEYNLNGAPFPARSVASMEDADVGGVRWDPFTRVELHELLQRGSLGGAKFMRSGQTGKNRRYDAINPCLFVVDLDGKPIRVEEEEEEKRKIVTR